MDTYTLKQLYAFAEKYYDECQRNGDEPQVGDFIDWIASQDTPDQASREEKQLEERFIHVPPHTYRGNI